MTFLFRKFTVAKPDGWFWRTDDGGKVDEADLMQCKHCQYTWRYVPGSGRKRGWCLHCNGPLCGKKKCMERCDPIEEQIQRGGPF